MCLTFSSLAEKNINFRVEMELLVYTFKTLIAQIWYQLVYFDDMLLAA